MLGQDQGEQERGWNPSDEHTPMEKVMKSSVLALASSDEHTLMNETIVGRWWNGPASCVMTTFASGIQKIRKGVCEK